MRRPTRARATIAEVAVRVLRAAVARAGANRIDDDAVRLALRCLLPIVGDPALLAEFWTYAGQLPHANRADSCAAVLGSILADMRAAGSYPGEDLERRRLVVEITRAFHDDHEARRAAHRRYYFAPPKRRT